MAAGMAKLLDNHNDETESLRFICPNQQRKELTFLQSGVCHIRNDYTNRNTHARQILFSVVEIQTLFDCPHCQPASIGHRGLPVMPREHSVATGT
jgi:hypothetical protein